MCRMTPKDPGEAAANARMASSPRCSDPVASTNTPSSVKQATTPSQSPWSQAQSYSATSSWIATLSSTSPTAVTDRSAGPPCGTPPRRRRAPRPRRAGQPARIGSSSFSCSSLVRLQSSRGELPAVGRPHDVIGVDAEHRDAEPGVLVEVDQVAARVCPISVDVDDVVAGDVPAVDREGPDELVQLGMPAVAPAGVRPLEEPVLRPGVEVALNVPAVERAVVAGGQLFDGFDVVHVFLSQPVPVHVSHTTPGVPVVRSLATVYDCKGAAWRFRTPWRRTSTSSVPRWARDDSAAARCVSVAHRSLRALWSPGGL